MSKDDTHFPLDSQDDARLRQLRWATFDPQATITLPSGVTIRGDEAQVLTSVYHPDYSRFPDINRAKLLGQTIQLETLPNPPAPAAKRSEYSSSWLRRLVWQFFR